MWDWVLQLARWRRLWRDTFGQDMIEYALMAGLVSLSAGALMPGVAGSITTVLSKVGSVMTVASNTGSASSAPPADPAPGGEPTSPKRQFN